MTCYLADINVWIAIACSVHSRHTVAREWFHSLHADQIWFCRFTQIGFLRLLTNPSVTGAQVRTQEQAWSIYDEFLRNARVGYLDEPSGVSVRFRGLASARQPATKVWADAYIAAVGLQAGLAIATFDHDFLAMGVPAVILASSR
jgi:toxin-antitoxin system PIN domain toxin